MCSPWQIRLTHTQLDFHFIPPLNETYLVSKCAGYSSGGSFSGYGLGDGV